MSRLCTLLLVAIASAGFGQAPEFPDFSRWEIVDPAARQMTYMNRPSLFLSGGIALMPETQLADGTIEFDVAIHGQQGFAGVVFRATSHDDYELIYLRTHRSRQWDALQYTPIFAGQEAWQLYSGQGYNGAAELPANRWVRVRVVVEGYQAQVFIDEAPKPQLLITDLKREWTSGRIGLWGRFGAANVSNFKVTPLERSRPPARRLAAPAPGVIARWSLSQALAAADVPPDRVPDGLTWESVVADATGIVNIAAVRRPPPGAKTPRSTVFARAVLRVPEDQRVRLAFGYSDEVTIFLDGRRVFSGRNGYLARDGSSLGTLTLGPDAIFLDLPAGRHELVCAVTEVFGGWGIAARLDDARGISVE